MGNLEICFLMDLEKGRFLEKASRKKKDAKSGEWRWASLGEERWRHFVMLFTEELVSR